MCVPKCTCVEAVKPFLEKRSLAGLKGLRLEPDHGSGAGKQVETLRLWLTPAALFKRGPFGSRRNGAMHVDG